MWEGPSQDWFADMTPAPGTGRLSPRLCDVVQRPVLQMADVAHRFDAPAVAGVADEIVAGIGDGEVPRGVDRQPEDVIEDCGQYAAVGDDGDLLAPVALAEPVERGDVPERVLVP